MKIAITEIDDDVVRRFAQYRCRALAAGKPIVCRPDMSIAHAGSLVSWWNTGRWRRRHMSCQVWTFTRPKLLLDLAETASGDTRAYRQAGGADRRGRAGAAGCRAGEVPRIVTRPSKYASKMRTAPSRRRRRHTSSRAAFRRKRFWRRSCLQICRWSAALPAGSDLRPRLIRLIELVRRRNAPPEHGKVASASQSLLQQRL